MLTNSVILQISVVLNDSVITHHNNEWNQPLWHPSIVCVFYETIIKSHETLVSIQRTEKAKWPVQLFSPRGRDCSLLTRSIFHFMWGFCVFHMTSSDDLFRKNNQSKMYQLINNVYSQFFSLQYFFSSFSNVSCRNCQFIQSSQSDMSINHVTVITINWL